MANRKTENDLLMTKPRRATAVQMALPIEVKLEGPELTVEQQKQRDNFQAFLANCRKEASQILLIAQMQNPGAPWGKLQEVPTPELAKARAAYDERPAQLEPVPHPEVWPSYQAQAEADRMTEQPRKVKQPQAYKPWSLERRQRLAASKLRQRAIKRSAFPEFWIPAVQEQVMKEPWRFGVCPLPSEDACIIPNPDRILSRQKAIAFEVECRQKEALPEPLKMPIQLEQRELVEVEVRSHLSTQQKAPKNS